MSLITFLPLIITAGGLFVILRLRGFFILHPIRTVRRLACTLCDRDARTSLALALAGTLGIGNIVGVAVGISVGGAGSVFWLLISSVFASALKYAESSLAADMYTTYSDGMMSVLSSSFPRLGRPLSVTYALACIVLSLAMGAALQSSGVISSAGQLSLPPVIVGVIFSAAVLAVICFGPERVGGFTAVIIPITTVVYVLLALATIFSVPARLPSVISDVFHSAFSPTATVGGMFGFVTSSALREGFSRGLLSNEAGAGTSSLAHSRLSRDPSTAGLLGMCEVFFDTVLLCPLTAIAILVAVPDPSLYPTGISLVLASVGATSPALVIFCIAAFAFSTVICWYCYGSRCLTFIGLKSGKFYLITFLGATLLGTILTDRILITVTDHVLLLLTILTLLAIIKNSDRLVRLSENGGLLGDSE